MQLQMFTAEVMFSIVIHVKFSLICQFPYPRSNDQMKCTLLPWVNFDMFLTFNIVGNIWDTQVHNSTKYITKFYLFLDIFRLLYL